MTDAVTHVFRPSNEVIFAVQITVDSEGIGFL